MKNITLALCLFLILITTQCSPKPTSSAAEGGDPAQTVKVGADQLDILLPKLKDKNVALVVNHTSLVGETHLADTLMSSGVIVKKVFAPEHGFRGAAADGENISDGVDPRTGLPIVSLYGANRKPTPE